MKEQTLNSEASKIRWMDYLQTLETDTRKKYTRVVTSYSDYCESNQIDTSHIESIRKYMGWLRNNDKILVSTLRSYLSAISLWYSISFDAPKPSESDEELKSMLNVWQLSDPHTQAGLFTLEDIENYLNADESFNKILEKKVFLLIGIYGLLRLNELSKLESKNVQKMNNNTYVITVMRNVQNKSLKSPTSFVIEGDRNIRIIDRYIKALGNHIDGKFFKKLDSFQNISEKSMCDFTKDIANFLGKLNYKSYTSHSIRRSGATILAEEGAAMTLIKAVGGWKSYNAVKRYMDTNNHSNNSSNFDNKHSETSYDIGSKPHEDTKPSQTSLKTSYELKFSSNDSFPTDLNITSHFLKRSSETAKRAERAERDDHSPLKKSNIDSDNNSLQLYHENESMNDMKGYSCSSSYNNSFDFSKMPPGYFPNYYFQYYNSPAPGSYPPTPPLMNPFTQSFLFNQLKNYYSNNNGSPNNFSPGCGNHSCNKSHCNTSNCQSCSPSSSKSSSSSSADGYPLNDHNMHSSDNHPINTNHFWNGIPFFQNYPSSNPPMDPFFQQYLFSLYLKNMSGFSMPLPPPHFPGNNSNSSSQQYNSPCLKFNSSSSNDSAPHTNSVSSNNY